MSGTRADPEAERFQSPFGCAKMTLMTKGKEQRLQRATFYLQTINFMGLDEKKIYKHTPFGPPNIFDPSCLC